jgi:phosphopantothenoylcysteine synthetase/decarboxylase
MAKKIMITAGGTAEKIDNVRTLSNVSTGQTGAEIANWFLDNDWEVTYVVGVNGELPNPGFPEANENLTLCFVESCDDALSAIIDIAPEMDAVVHTMAVSDFTFTVKDDIKLDSSDTDAFIEHLSYHIKTTPKILPKIREANKDAFIVGFKYTVGEDDSEQIKIARKQIDEYDINATFVNDDTAIKRMGERVGYLVTEESYSNLCYGRREIGDKIYEMVNSNTGE